MNKQIEGASNTLPLISVIIPAYNAEEYIEDTLRSVFEQTYPNLEILVVDDGSSDNTLQILKQYDSRLSVFVQNNEGVSKARNYAAEKSGGEWLAFIDADDLWAPDKLSVQLDNIDKENWSHTNSVYFGYHLDGKTKRSDLTPQFDGFVFDELIVNNFITTSTVLIRKDTFFAHGGFDESLKALEDWKLWLEVALKEPLNYHSMVLAEYRVTPGSTSRKAREVLPMHLELIDGFFSKYKELQNKNHLKKQALYHSYSICSYIAEDANDYRFSLQCSVNAWRNNKLEASAVKRVMRTMLNSCRKIT